MFIGVTSLIQFLSKLQLNLFIITIKNLKSNLLIGVYVVNVIG